MTSGSLDELARQAASGDRVAADLFLVRLRDLLGLLDPETLTQAIRTSLSLKDGLTPGLLQWAREQLTPEELASALHDLRELREQVDKGGGLELKDFLPELEQMVPRS